MSEVDEDPLPKKIIQEVKRKKIGFIDISQIPKLLQQILQEKQIIALECKGIQRVEILEGEGYYFVCIPKRDDWSTLDTKEKELIRECLQKPGMHFFYTKDRTVSQEQFLQCFPPSSLSIDGFQNAPPNTTEAEDGSPRDNADHHEGVVRNVTLSSAQQVLEKIVMGEFQERFCNAEGETNANIFFNDIDEDVLLCLYLLKNMGKIQRMSLRDSSSCIALHGFVSVCGALDRKAGPYPVNENLRQQIKWAFLPLMFPKRKGFLDTLSMSDLHALLERSFARIDAFFEGKAKETPLENRYVAQKFPEEGWAFVSEEESPEARVDMLTEDIPAIVSFQGERRKEDDSMRYSYIIFKLKESSRFPIREIFALLNLLERVKPEHRHRPIQKLLENIENAQGNDEAIEEILLPFNPSSQWGGGDRVGGPPRGEGTWMNPHQMIEVVNFCISKCRRSEKQKTNGGNGKGDGEALFMLGNKTLEENGASLCDAQ